MKSASSKKSETLTICVVIGLVAGGALSISAQQQQDPVTVKPATSQPAQSGLQQWQQTGQRSGTATGVQQTGTQQGLPLRQVQPTARLSKLLGREVQGPDGQKLGEVEEIILSQDRRSVDYVRLSLDDGPKIRLSLNELFAKQVDDDVLMVRSSGQELQQRQTQERDQTRVGSEQELASRRVSKLIGSDLQGTDGKGAGSINDLIIDTQSGKIKNAAVKTGGIVGVGTRLASVEWQGVNFAADGDAASINMTTEKLSELAYKEDEYWERNKLSGVDGQTGSGLQQVGADGMIQEQAVDQNRPAGTANVTTKVDNSARNVRDRNDATLTSFDQGNSTADTGRTAQIRKEINATKNMSISGKNVKIITKDGRVTLRGPVDNAEEKRIIGEIANRIAQAVNVDNQLEVKYSNTTSTSID